MQMQQSAGTASASAASRWWLEVGHGGSVYMVETGKHQIKAYPDHLDQLENVDILNLWERILIISKSVLHFADSLFIVGVVNLQLFVCMCCVLVKPRQFCVPPLCIYHFSFVLRHGLPVMLRLLLNSPSSCLTS